MTCATSVELSDEASTARVSSCIKALLVIFQYSRECKAKFSVPDQVEKELKSQQAYIQRLMDDFKTLCVMGDPILFLRTSCIRALAVQGLLSQLVPQDSRIIYSLPFPVSFIPIYKFLFPKDIPDTIRQVHDGRTPSDEENVRMWKSLLRDGPLANLTMLAQAVRVGEQAPPSTLSFCWKALDVLLMQLGTIHFEKLTRAQSDFDSLHKNTRKYVHEKRGFRVTPLLDRLDTVSRGRRLLMLLSGHPKYHNRVDVVFGKEFLRNGDLLEAFVHCLPDFIKNNPLDVSKDFMEKVIRHDDLWTSLQVNLWNTQWSDSPTPDKLRVFEDCCTVLDLAFSVLEDSQGVDWRASEFMSLLQHFESFIAHCFQGAFIEKLTSFRVGIIKAQSCKALLAQLWNDHEREGIVSFRSQWDVASFARVIHSLSLRDKDDAEFWSSYVNGGHVGEDFKAKAQEMIKITACDGPILIFCQLGHLAAAAVPLSQSGLESEDIEKVWEPQKKVIEKRRLPLKHASDTVWEALIQLREEVNDHCGKSTGKDRDILRRLLLMIDDVHNLRFPGEEGTSQSEHTEEQGLKTLFTANQTLPSGDSSGISHRLALGSTPGPAKLPASEGGNDFERGSSLLIPRISIDLQPDRPEDYLLLDCERTTYARSESPERYGPPSPNLNISTLHPPAMTVQGTGAGIGIMDRSGSTTSSLAISPVIPYFSYMGDARQRRTYSSTRRTGSRFSATGPGHVTGASTGALLTSHRDATTFLPNTIITSSPRGSFDIIDEKSIRR